MNWRRGLWRIWVVASIVWIVGFGSLAALAWQHANVFDQFDGFATLDEPQTQSKEMVSFYAALPYLVMAVSGPLLSLSIGLAALWAVRGFKADKP